MNFKDPFKPGPYTPSVAWQCTFEFGEIRLVQIGECRYVWEANAGKDQLGNTRWQDVDEAKLKKLEASIGKPGIIFNAIVESLLKKGAPCRRCLPGII